MTAEIFTVVNQKGGVGKSTTVQMLGAGLKKQGKRVLFIDADPQGNLSYAFGIQEPAISTMQVLSGINTASEAIVHTDLGDIMPSSLRLATADMEFRDTGREYLLREAIEGIRSDYDFILIDTPPALGILSVNALTCADKAIIPTVADIFALQGIGSVFGTIAQVKKYTNKNLKVSGILVTRYSARSNISKQVNALIADTAEKLQSKAFKTFIRECSAIREAQAVRKDVFEHAPRSNAVLDYMAFINELLQD